MAKEETYKIRATRNFLHEGEHQAIKTELTLPESEAQNLVNMNKAVFVGKKPSDKKKKA